jgi:hypothetical protein
MACQPIGEQYGPDFVAAQRPLADKYGFASSASLIDYPFSLRSGQVAHLRLPMKLEKVDADRLGAFIRTLVFEPQLEIPAHTEEAA